MTNGPGPVEHGGPDALGTPRIDFSSNGNACGPCPAALAAVRAADPAAYPDPAYTALREVLAGWHGVAPGRIVVAASASEFAFRIAAWVARRSPQAGAWWPQPGYADWSRGARAAGLLPAAQPNGAALVWACEPSSPLGQPQPGLDGLLTCGSAAALVLDRAYDPLRLHGPLAQPPDRIDRVWQLWSPNKALGLMGVRGAYAVAPEGAEDDAARLDALAPSWPLGAHGVAMLSAWVTPDAQAWLAASLVALAAWKQRQVALCESLGWRCEPSLANFFSARPGLQGDALRAALDALRGQGIKLRHGASFGLPGHVRLSVMPPEAQDELAHAWRALDAAGGAA